MNAGQAAIVDVSNVCWSTDLPPIARGPSRPILARLPLLVNAWRRAHGSDAPMRFVADASLRHCLTVQDRQRWQDTARRWNIEVVPVADRLILSHAEAEALTVLSRDRFLDFRRVHPWIEEHPTRFQRWQVAGDDITFVPVGIVPEKHHVVSQHEEAKQLQAQGLHPRMHRALLSTRWRCTEWHCLHARLWQECLLVWPSVDRAGQARCPGCGSKLTSLGPRARTRQIIVSTVDGEREHLRFPVEAGAPLVLGRGRLDNGVSLDAVADPPARVGRLSRLHAVISLDELGALRVVDIGSANGTTLHRTDTDAGRRLVAGQEATLPERGHLRLAGVVRVDLSGQRFLADTRPPATAGAAAPETDVTSAADPHRPR